MARPVTDLSLILDVPSVSAPLTVASFQAREAISEPYEAVITFTADEILDAEAFVGQPASLQVASQYGAFEVNGLVWTFEYLGFDREPRGYAHRLTLRPRLMALGLHRQNQIHGPRQPVDVKDLIQEAVAGAKDPQRGIAVDITLDFALASAYPKRPFVVQYQESDLAFLSRICESEGVFFFFSHREGKEFLTFGDDNVIFPPFLRPSPDEAEDPARRPELVFGKPGEGGIFKFGYGAHMTPRSFVIADYDESRPAEPPRFEHGVPGGLHGLVHEFGDLVQQKRSDDGGRIARVRAEEIACRRLQFQGRCGAPGLRAGTVFDMTNHPDPRLDRRYLVIACEHGAVLQGPVVGGEIGAGTPYETRFTCIPADVPFRPARTTPQPVIAGIHTATVEGDKYDGERSDIDAHGRYKITFAHPSTKAERMQGSDYVRKAEPYMGPKGTGMTFPLLPRAEVVVAYINGDPDRPIILGAVPNAETGAVVTAQNFDVNRLVTPSGSLFEIGDSIPGGSGS